jgi:hypothetical protein
VSDDRRVDDLRQQLRSLGYLDGGVDRFVLAPAVRRRRPAIIALLASVRSGLIAAVLLGPAAAVGLGARLPSLVTGPRDAIVIAIYMAVLFGAAVTVLSFLAALIVSAAARSAGSQRGRALSTAAGVIVSVVCLVYLTLWWRTANAGFGWDAPVWTAFALVVAVAISLLMGHVVTLTARAVMLARTPPDVETPRGPGTSWKLAGAAGVLAFAGAASLLVVTADTAPVDTPAPFAVRSTSARVTVLAIDGFDPRLYDQLHPRPTSGVRQGGGGLRVEPYRLHDVLGWSRAQLAATDSSDPARLWTTIATGRHPEAHGVQRLETRRVAGLQGRLTSDAVGRLLGGATDLLRLTRPATASNLERRVKTFWEVAALAGLRTGVVNWWATWPADPSAGMVISDRAILRLERGGALDAELAPAELYDRLRATWSKLHADASARATAYFSERDPRYLWGVPTHIKLQPLPPDRLLPELPPDIKTVLTRSGELDAAMMKLAESIGTDVDLLVVYLPGLDIAQHTLLANDTPAPSTVEQRIAALRRYYDYLDSVVSDSVANVHWEHNRYLFVVTQPGRLHQGAGLLGAAGSPFREMRTSGSVLDVAPTILHSLGVPVAQNLDGNVVEDLFSPKSLKEHPVRLVNSYGLKGSVPRSSAGEPLDAEAIERLRSLGYIK